MGINKKISLKVENNLVDIINKSNISDDEARQIIKEFKKTNFQKYNKSHKISLPNNHLVFGGFTDCHIGHKNYRDDILQQLIQDGKRKGVKFWINAGDTIEGMSGREGHIYELNKIGATAQLEYFKEEFSQFKVPVYSIEAQGSHGGWFKTKGNAGLDIGKELEMRCDNYKFLGYDEQDLQLSNGLKIRLRHPGGGTAYAISYKMQKYVEAISGGDKPNMIFQGHFHKANQIFYRNIFCIDGGCLQEQSPFMKKIGTPAHLGYYLFDVTMHKNKKKGIERLKTEFVPFYD